MSIKLHHSAARCSDPPRLEFGDGAMADYSRKVRSKRHFARPDGGDDDDPCQWTRRSHLLPRSPLPKRDPRSPDCL